MKKTITFLTIFLSFFVVKAQDESSNENNKDKNLFKNSNEVKLNGLYLLAGAFEVSYEYLLNEESGIGITVLLPFDNEVKDDIKYYISPYYRHYFGEKYAGGFFVEGFGMLNSSSREFLGNENSEFVTDFALGLGFGGKWISRRNVIFELSFGLGRNLFKQDETDFDLVGKGGFNIGFRF